MSKAERMQMLKVLFLCTGNSCRSQMAEGWARHLKSDRFEAYSAGVEKHGLNPLAVAVMAEAGVDISAQESTTVDELPSAEFDWVVTLCDQARESCPYVPGRTVHRGFKDPPTLARDLPPCADQMEPYRRVRDQIRAFVESLPQALHEGRNGFPELRAPTLRDGVEVDADARGRILLGIRQSRQGRQNELRQALCRHELAQHACDIVHELKLLVDDGRFDFVDDVENGQ